MYDKNCDGGLLTAYSQAMERRQRGVGRKRILSGGNNLAKNSIQKCERSGSFHTILCRGESLFVVMSHICHRATVATYVDDLVGAMRLDRDVESIRRANQGLAAVEGAVKERSLKYQELIKGVFATLLLLAKGSVSSQS